MEFFTSKVCMPSVLSSGSKIKQGISIQLDRPLPVYFAGEKIAGRVIVTYEKQREFKELSITFEGQARVQWSEKRGKTRSQKSATECYFNAKQILHANLNSEESVTVLPGISSFPFSFQLPLHIPSSFNSDIGQVVYSMTARLKTSWYKFDLVSSIQFTVTGILDLNREPVVSQPIEIENQKFFCTWPPCKDSVIEVRALFPRKGFVPGEIASFTVEINNESTRSVNKIKAELIQTVSYYAKSSKREGNSVLEKEKEEINVQPGESETWKQNALKIPPCPPSRLAYGCHIIDVHYYIRITVKFSGLAKDLIINQEIIIGTIPLMETFSQLVSTNRRRDYSQYTDNNSPRMNNSDYAEVYGNGCSSVLSPGPFYYPTGRNRSASLSHSPTPSAPSPVTVNLPPPEEDGPPPGIFMDYPDLPPPSYKDVMGNELKNTGQGFFTSETVGSTRSVNESGMNNDEPPPVYNMARNTVNFTPAYATYEYRTEK